MKAGKKKRPVLKLPRQKARSRLPGGTAAFRRFFLPCLVLAAGLFPLAAQEFGFGFDAGDGEEAFAGSGGNAVRVSIGGEVSASLPGFLNDFADGAESTRLGDIFSGKLKFSAEGSRALGLVNLNLMPRAPFLALDEAYIRAYFGSFDLEAGLRKLSWGKADSLGPLDVVNPLDYSDLSGMDNPENLKIARPLVHASLRFGRFSKLEWLFVPGFEPPRFAESGRWMPAQLASLPPSAINEPADTDKAAIAYAQAGTRFTTTIGSSDIGAQYYYGRLPLPAFVFSFSPAQPPLITVDVYYNRYHQIGVDFGRVVAGFNIRAEFAANLTEDFGGSDGGVYNPHLAWSFGFDRDLFWNINANIQAAETIILLHNRTGGNPLLDIEAEKDMTATRITARLAKPFFRDEFEIAIAALWGLEDMDCLVMPGITWTKGDLKAELSGGFFAGPAEGQFGQYRDNNFIRGRITYTF
jgi:hypothetical protein